MQWIDAKYAAMLAPQLRLFKKLKPNVWCFRCPICGDSHKDTTKARGYFYPHKDTIRFRCHNCGAGDSFYKFLEKFDSTLFAEYKLERFREKKNNVRILKQLTPPPKPPVIHRKPKQRKTLYGAPRLADLQHNHPAILYVRERMIPPEKVREVYFTDDIGSIAKQLSGYEDTYFGREPHILFPFINEDEELTHIQGRAIGKDIKKSRRFVSLEVIADTPKVFGMNKIDHDKPVIVVEGPIDSLFLDNCVAMGGSDIDYSLFNEFNTIFVYDNEPRNREIIFRMERAVRNSFNVCVWPNTIKPKEDINDMIKRGLKPEEIHSIILANSFRGMKANLAINQFNKISKG